MLRLTEMLKWQNLTEAEKVAYGLELSKAFTVCENFRLQHREYKLRPSKSGPPSRPFSVEVERCKILDLIAWKYEQAFTVYDKLLVKHMVQE